MLDLQVPTGAAFFAEVKHARPCCTAPKPGSFPDPLNFWVVSSAAVTGV